MPTKSWTQEQALALCREIEKIAPLHSCHVALTGGCLYKSGPRKDLDIVFYRIRQADAIELDSLFEELHKILGIERKTGFGWCIKAELNGQKIDCFFPEEMKVIGEFVDERCQREYGES